MEVWDGMCGGCELIVGMMVMKMGEGVGRSKKNQ